MNRSDRTLDEFRARIGRVLALKYFVGFATVWAFAWGTAVLAARTAFGTDPVPLLWGLAGVPLALVPAVVLAGRRTPSPVAVRALLDRHNACGGLYMAGAEQELGAWESRLKKMGEPPVRWRGGKPTGLFGVALAFLVSSFLVPDKLVALPEITRLEIGRDIERLDKQITLLKDEKILEPARAEAMAQKLQQLRDESDGRNPVKTLEALDHLRDVASKAAKSAAESAQRQSEKFGKAEALTEALRKSGGAMNAKTMAEAMKEVANLTKRAMAENDLLAKKKENADSLQQLEQGKPLPGEKLQQLAAELRGNKQELRQKMEALMKEGLIDRETLEALAKAAAEQFDDESLAQLLSEADGSKSLQELLDELEGDMNGGNPDEGGGHVRLRFGDESSSEGVKFKETALPPASLKAMKESKLQGVSPGAPRVEQNAQPGAAGALTGANAGGGSANTQTVLPRHKAAVEAYFERKKN